MKTRILTALLLMATVVGFAQKRDIRRASRAVEKGDFEKAKEHLQDAEADLSGANSDTQADYYFYKGYALIGDSQNVPTSDLEEATEAFRKAQELGHEDAQQGLEAMSIALVNSAIADQQKEDFTSASEKLYNSYDLNKQDTLYLYYAAANAVSAGDYDTALEYYEELKDLGYSGEEIQYTAVSPVTGEREVMPSEEERDIFVNSGGYTDPQEQKSESRAGEIAKNIALIYVEKGETDKAIAAINEAKRENPDDIGLMEAEADMYYSMGDMQKFRETMEEIVKQDPNNPLLFYNLGVSTAELGEADKAIEYYERALELDPEMTNAKINIAYVILSRERPIVEEMNSLGTSAAENKRYEELEEERKQVYRDALPHLQDVLETDPNNLEAARTVMNIYYQIGETEKAEEMQQRVDEIEANSGNQ